MLTENKINSGAKLSAQPTENSQPSAKYRKCFMCQTWRMQCVYIKRIGLCDDCFNARIWRGEQTRFVDFIISREANR